MGKLLFFSFLLLAMLGAASGCALNKEAATGDWKDEVLWAKECGEAGLPCCSDREPACSYGLSCCLDPNDPARSRCAEDCACGGEGDYCCAGEPACATGLACYQGDCRFCGGGGEPCCPGEPACRDSRYCHGGLCVDCGLPGNPCCRMGAACAGEGELTPARTECREGVCIMCGYGDKIACPNDPPCNPKHLLNGDTCYLCGGANQPCCDAAATGYECDPAAGLVCQLGFCSRE